MKIICKNPFLQTTFFAEAIKRETWFFQSLRNIHGSQNKSSLKKIAENSLRQAYTMNADKMNGNNEKKSKNLMFSWSKEIHKNRNNAKIWQPRILNYVNKTNNWKRKLRNWKNGYNSF